MIDLSAFVPRASLWAMLGEGLLAFISPCVLPMLPVYALYLVGGNTETGEERARWGLVLRRCLGLALSFIALFTLIGAGAGFLGGALKNADRGLLDIVSGGLMIIFGLWMLDLFHWSGPRLPGGIGGKMTSMNGFWGAFAVGILLALSWTPCLTPLLGSALVLAASSEGATMWTGMLQLAVFALGLALPMILFIMLYQWLREALSRLRRYQGLLRRAGGALMIVYGLYKAISAMVR
ncbi:MAG: cytochrome c biogenesis CcdA family protein [Clostridia bacterium]|nr:cytochrome c biogenesis CcdA family protein [Clostridia bacterium]